MLKNNIKYILIFVVVLVLNSCLNKQKFEPKIINSISYQLLPYKNLENNEVTCFKLIVSESNESNRIKDYYKPDNYNKLLYYINKNIESDLKIKIEKEELNPVMVHFESNMKITSRIIFLVAFKKIESDKEIYFQFDDNLFNNGIIKFNINKNYII